MFPTKHHWVHALFNEAALGLEVDDDIGWNVWVSLMLASNDDEWLFIRKMYYYRLSC